MTSIMAENGIGLELFAYGMSKLSEKYDPETYYIKSMVTTTGGDIIIVTNLIKNDNDRH